jgi:uncharacterized membrane protein
MKKFILLCVALAATTGCNNTTKTGSTRVSPTSNEQVAKTLSLTSAKEQTIEKNGTDKVDVSISRTNFEDPVTIAVTNLPKGVELVDKELLIASGSKSLTFTLKAAADAVAGDHQVTLTASAPGVPNNSQTFKLTVK